jgi:hypothetical protein
LPWPDFGAVGGAVCIAAFFEALIVFERIFRAGVLSLPAAGSPRRRQFI